MAAFNRSLTNRSQPTGLAPTSFLNAGHPFFAKVKRIRPLQKLLNHIGRDQTANKQDAEYPHRPGKSFDPSDSSGASTETVSPGRLSLIVALPITQKHNGTTNTNGRTWSVDVPLKGNGNGNGQIRLGDGSREHGRGLKVHVSEPYESPEHHRAGTESSAGDGPKTSGPRPPPRSRSDASSLSDQGPQSEADDGADLPNNHSRLSGATLNEPSNITAVLHSRSVEGREATSDEATVLDISTHPGECKSTPGNGSGNGNGGSSNATTNRARHRNSNRVNKSSSSSRPGKPKAGQPLAPDDEGEDDENEAHGDDPFPPGPPTSGAPQSGPRLFACPFYRADPIRYASCNLRNQLKSTNYVRQHILRAHKQPKHCPRCGTIFRSQVKLNAHIREKVPCETQEYELEGITPAQEEALQSKDRRGAVDDRYGTMWKILFGDEAPEPVQHLHNDNEISDLMITLHGLYEKDGYQARFVDGRLGTGSGSQDVTQELRRIDAEGLHNFMDNLTAYVAAKFVGSPFDPSEEGGASSPGPSQAQRQHLATGPPYFPQGVSSDNPDGILDESFMPPFGRDSIDYDFDYGLQPPEGDAYDPGPTFFAQPPDFPVSPSATVQGIPSPGSTRPPSSMRASYFLNSTSNPLGQQMRASGQLPEQGSYGPLPGNSPAQTLSVGYLSRFALPSAPSSSFPSSAAHVPHGGTQLSHDQPYAAVTAQQGMPGIYMPSSRGQPINPFAVSNSRFPTTPIPGPSNEMGCDFGLDMSLGTRVHTEQQQQQQQQPGGGDNRRLSHQSDAYFYDPAWEEQGQM